MINASDRHSVSRTRLRQISRALVSALISLIFVEYCLNKEKFFYMVCFLTLNKCMHNSFWNKKILFASSLRRMWHSTLDDLFIFIYKHCKPKTICPGRVVVKKCRYSCKKKKQNNFAIAITIKMASYFLWNSWSEGHLAHLTQAYSNRLYILRKMKIERCLT